MTGEDWRQLLGVASRLRREGRIAGAIDAYRRLLAANPHLPDSWYNLAWLQRQARDFAAALTSYQRALDHDVADPEEVRLNRAAIYSDHLHRPEEAAQELEAALQANPHYVPALLNLGNLREDLGDRDSARAAYSRAIEAEPENRLALARIAGVSHASNLDRRLAERLRAALRMPDVSSAERADLGFALAGLLDAAGEYDEAFEAAREANVASHSASNARYHRAAVEQFVDRLIATFDESAARGDQGPSPLFICGMFRSGSTLVEQILGAHSHVRTAGELDQVPQLVATIRGYPESVRDASEETVDHWRRSYLQGLPAQPTRDLVVTDKRPDNFLHIGLIKTMFPSAKIIHTRRDPLDNLLSLYFLHLDPGMSYALNLEDAAHWYRQHERLMAHWKSLYRDDTFELDYDELVRDPRPVIERLLEFLGLGWEDDLLDFHRARTVVKTASVWQVRQPLHARSSGRWRNYRKQLERVEALLRNP